MTYYSSNGCSGNWTVQGQKTSPNSFNLSGTPAGSICGQNSYSAILNLNSCSAGDTSYVFGQNGSGLLSGGGGSATSNGNWIRNTSPPSFSTNPFGIFYMSTGDTRQITTSASVSTALINVSYQPGVTSFPNSSCGAGFTIPDASGTGSASSTISIYTPDCAGLYTYFGATNGTTTNYFRLIIPPQALIQVLYGEANGQVGAYGSDDPSELAIGATIRERLGKSQFGDTSSYQSIITNPNQYNGYPAGLNVVTGVAPELNFAGLLYGGASATAAQQRAMDVGGSTCFFSPTDGQWATINSKLNDPNVKALRVNSDGNTRDPNCYGRNLNEKQFVIKRSISDNLVPGKTQAPAFVFQRPKAPSAPVVVDIP